MPAPLHAIVTAMVLWTPEGINFGIDDVGYYRFPNDGRGDRAIWPFDAPFYMILNIAVGGDWGGTEGIDDRAFPQLLAVDYVRVFSRAPNHDEPEPALRG